MRNLSTRITAVTAAVLGMAGMLGPTSASAAEPMATSGCVFAAHRGYTAAHIENSRLSMAAAIHRHADYLEMDVQVSKDGRFTLMHDETIDRTTNGHGRVVDKTWAQLREVRLDDGQRLPSLGSVLAMAKRHDTKLMLELKWVPSSRFARFAEVVRDFGADQVVVNSFSPYVVKTFHQRYPDVPTALDTTGATSLTGARAYGGLMPDSRKVGLSWLGAAKKAGVPVYLAAVDSDAGWARYRNRVTAVLTNRAGDYDAWRAKHCA